MIDFIFGTVWGWIGTAGVVVAICAVVAIYVPQFRAIALAVAGVVISAATIYTKGNRDRAALEKRRRDEAVRKVKGEYDAIDKRPDTPDDVARRLRNRSF